MIKALRVDYRLLHGQVAFAWANYLKINAILVANDQVVHDEMRKSALRLAKPATSKLIFKTVEDSIQAIKSGVTDKYSLFIVVESIEDAKRLSLALEEIEEINLGLSMKKENSVMLAKAVYVDDQEKKDIEEMLDRGVVVFLQQAPTDSKELISKNTLEEK